MNNRLVKYSLAAGLALFLALPAVAYSQYSADQGPRFAGDGWSPGKIAPMSVLPQQRAQGRFGNAQTPPRGSVGRAGRGRDNRRGVGRQRDRGDFGRRSRGAPGIGDRGGRSSLAARALGRADQIGLTAEQRDQIRAAQRAVREASINRRATTQIAELELRDLMGAETRDIAAIEAKLRELAEQRIAEQTGALRLDEAVSETLTDEQVDELGDLTRDRGRDRSGRRGGRGRRAAR
jgi:Spy/CpxP family protein refolding chaperone